MKLPLAASLARFVSIACGMSIVVLACGRDGGGDRGVDEAEVPPVAEVAPMPDDAFADSARANMVDTRGVGIGAVILTAVGEGVTLRGALIGLPPGEHGFHIHETGSCEPPAFESAGDHLGAGEAAHGFDAPGGPHAGDLRNLMVAEDSTATVEQVAAGVSLSDGGVELLDDDGAAIVIHAQPDDYATQPSGASGDRIACGVIEG
ncbi:MAG TPA: superoxide dismutase family protein [Gemmatimonadota bacterium]|nr:superoxide dismutase family protein [Gemmatimonadota bacterium]